MCEFFNIAVNKCITWCFVHLSSVRDHILSGTGAVLAGQSVCGARRLVSWPNIRSQGLNTAVSGARQWVSELDDWFLGPDSLSRCQAVSLWGQTVGFVTGHSVSIGKWSFFRAGQSVSAARQSVSGAGWSVIEAQWLVYVARQSISRPDIWFLWLDGRSLGSDSQSVRPNNRSRCQTVGVWGWTVSFLAGHLVSGGRWSISGAGLSVSAARQSVSGAGWSVIGAGWSVSRTRQSVSGQTVGVLNQTVGLWGWMISLWGKMVMTPLSLNHHHISPTVQYRDA